MTWHHHFEQPRTREEARLQRHIDSLERELDHRSDVISTLADSLAETRAELDDAIRAGSMFATALRWSMPSHPTLMERA